MNNFKKLLASAMALTMVTSVLPAATTTVSAAACDLVARNEATAVVDAIKQDLANAKLSLSNVKMDSKLDMENTRKAVGVGEAGNWNGVTFGGALGQLGTSLDALTDCNAHTADSLKITGFVDGVTELASDANKGLIYDLNKEFEDGGRLADDIISTNDWDEGISELYEDIMDVETYIGNVTVGETVGKYTVTEKILDTFKDNLADFKDLVDDYRSAYIGDYADDYADALLKQEVVNGVTVDDILDTRTRFPRTNLEALTEFLEDVRNDEHTFKDTDGSTIADLPSYELVEDENEVVEIMDELDAIVEDITAVNDLMNSRSDANRALKAVDDLVEQLADAQNEDPDKEAYVLDVITKFNAEDIDNVITYVEDFFNEFYTVRKTERSNGRYTAELEPTEIERYLTASESEDLQSSDIKVILTTLVDETSRTGDTYYDELVASEGTTKDDLIAIVEEGAEVELKFTYTDVEVEKVYNARAAAATLLPVDNDGKSLGNPYDLTARERRQIKSLQAYLNDVYERINNAEVIVTEEKDWWVYENGQWVFYQDGHTVSNRWVASNATDWYYAGANGVMLTNSWIARDSSLQVWYYVGADGKMVTNTVVDGCTIDANGEWHA